MPRNKLFDQDEVLDKVMNLFWVKGFNGTSIDDLVSTSGLSRSSLYDTFGDKQALYLTALKHYKKKAVQQRDKLLNSISSPKKRIEEFFYQTIDDILDDKLGKGCFMLNATTELANQMKQVYEEAGSNLVDMECFFLENVKEGQKLGEISKKHKPLELARYLFSSLNGMRTVGQTRKDKSLLNDIARVTLKTLT